MPWSRTTQWRQGSILSGEHFLALNLQAAPECELAVAVSHDCDIANDNLDAEPVIEFIFAKVIDQANGNYLYGKNPRILHLPVRIGETDRFIEMVAGRKTVVYKDNLESILPKDIYQLSVASGRILQSWLATRYRRHALPNSLVDRLTAVFDYIEKKGKKNSVGILSFRLSYEPRTELPPEAPYELWLNIVYNEDDESYGPMAAAIAHDIKSEFARLLVKTAVHGKVDLRRCEAVSEYEFTLRDMRDTEEFHIDHLSYRTEPPGPITY